MKLRSNPLTRTAVFAATIIGLSGSLAFSQTNLYWDISNASELTPGTGTWGTSAFWATLATPGTATPGAWTSGSNAFLQTLGTNTISIAAGGVTANSVTQTGTGTVTTISSNSLTITGAAGVVNSGNSTFTINSGLVLGSGTTTTYTFNAGSAITIGGSITQNGTASISKSGAGTLNLNASNSYSGSTAVTAGILKLGNAGALGNATTGTSAVNVSGSGILDLAGISPTRAAPLTLSSNAIGFDVGAFYNSSSTAVTYSGTVTLSANTRVGAGNITLNNTITGGSRSLNRDGQGTLTLANSGTVALAALQANRGTIQVDPGTTLNVTSINVGSGNNVGAGLTLNGGNVTYVGTTGTVSFGTAASGTASGTLTMNSGTFTVPSLIKGPRTFNVIFNGGTLKASADSATFFASATSAVVQAGGATLDDGGFQITVGQALTAASVGGGLTKVGNGTLTLNGVNTYTGDTTIKAGNLALGSTGSFATSKKIIVGDAGSSGTSLNLTALPAFSIGSTQTLQGIGTVNIGAGKTVTIEGTHAPGNGIGTQAVTGNLAYAAGSIFAWQLGSNVDRTNGTRGIHYDGLSVTGNLTVDQTNTTGATFSVILGTAFDGGDSFWLANRSWDVATVSGTTDTSFTNFKLFNASSPTTEVAYSQFGFFSYSSSAGTGSLSWTAVPEPTSALAGLLIGAGLLRRRRNA